MLTGQQRKFAEHLAVHGRPVEAFRHAYDVSGYSSANALNVQACRLAKSPNITLYLERLRADAAEREGVPELLATMLQRCVRIGTADPNQLFRVKTGNCRRCHGVDFLPMWRDDEYADAVALAERDRTPLPALNGGLGWRPFTPPHPDCPECGGGGQAHPINTSTDDLSDEGRLLFAGVKLTRYGPEVQMHDQGKYLDMAARMLGGFKDNVNLTATLAAAVQQLPPDATPETATRAYEALVRGGKPG